jgi:hypothetical protein
VEGKIGTAERAKKEGIFSYNHLREYTLQKFIYNNSRISDLKKILQKNYKKIFSMYMKDLWHTFLKKDHANFTGFSQGEKRKPFFKKNWQ